MAVIITIAGSTAILLSLPPSLSVSDGSRAYEIEGNFTAMNSLSPTVWYLNATTYANQTSGLSSTLTLDLKVYGFYDSAAHAIQFFSIATVLGKFSANIRPSGLLITVNETGPLVNVFGHVLPPGVNGRPGSPNVSFDQSQTIGFAGNGTGNLGVSLANQGGSTPQYEFVFFEETDLTYRYLFDHILGTRATVTGWLLPPISVSIVLRIANV